MVCNDPLKWKVTGKVTVNTKKNALDNKRRIAGKHLYITWALVSISHTCMYVHKFSILESTQRTIDYPGTCSNHKLI